MSKVQLLFATLVLSIASFVVASTDSAVDPLANYNAEKVSANTWVIHGPKEFPTPENKGFMNNPAFTVTDKSVVVFDPTSSLQGGEGLLKKIKKITDKPVTHVFISHVHGDHWLGNQSIKAAYPDAKFYAHPEMIKAANDGEAENWIALMENLTEGATKGTVAVIPDIALIHLQEIKIDNITVRAYLDDWAHTKSDAMFVIPEEKVLITGDNVTYQRIARMSDGNFQGNIAAIEKALETEVEIVIPGHGPTGGKEILGIFKNYLDTIYTASVQAVEDDKEPYEVKAELLPTMDIYHKWSGFEGEFGRHISQAILEAEDANF